MLCIASSVAQQPATPVRKPLPKPTTGTRGFEKYTGKDATSRLIAVGATREVVPPPRKPFAPLEGRSYSATPFFAWQAAFGSRSYHFILYDGDVLADKNAKIVYEKDVAATVQLSSRRTSARTRQALLTRVTTPSAKEGRRATVVTFPVLAGPEAAEVKQAINRPN